MNQPFPRALLILLASATCHHQEQDAGGAPKRDQNPSIRQLVESDAWNGRDVFVTGRCLGYPSGQAVGPPPVTRSDWLLAGDSAVIYVTGPLPSGCTATGGSTNSTTVHARVAQDTLPTLGTQPAKPRRYLVTLVH
jgi:hypothetical protein